MLVAVTVTEAGTIAGALYVPSAAIVPTVALPPTVPFTAQTTVLVLVLLTPALNLNVVNPRMVLVFGEIATAIGAATVIVLAVEIGWRPNLGLSL